MEKLTVPLADYPHIRRVGALVFVAGQGCRDPETNDYVGLVRDAGGTVISYDVSAQARGVLTNIERALRSHELDRRHLVDITVFLTSMDDFPAMNAVWDDWFKECLAPTRTTVCVKGLPGQNFIEMKAIASVDLPIVDNQATGADYSSERFHS